MPYFPPRPAYVYICQGCDRRYRVPEGGVTLSCCVAHPPDSCCHYGETELLPTEVQLELPFELPDVCHPTK